MRIIKKEIVIDAPLEVVWKHITDPQKIAGWLMPNTFEPTVGRAFTLECAAGGTTACVVKELVLHKKLVYSWRSSLMRVETLVTITLSPERGSTRVTLVHSGWDKLPPDEQGIADGHDQGWNKTLANLVEACARAVESGRAH